MSTTAAELIGRVKMEGVSEADKSLTTLGDAVDRVAERTKQSSEKTKAHAEGLKTLSNAALVTGAGMLAGFGIATNAVMGFDKEMSGVAAVANASAGDLDLLREAAINAGRDTAFSASEAAAAEGELVKAGVSVADVLGGALSGSLNLASAGQLDLAQSATISAQAMNIFNLEGKDVGHIADVLAAAANKSAADVGQLADALQQGGLVAKQTGLGLEDTTGVLALFADNALIGSDAGTSLKTMLQRLTPQSAEAKNAMADLGVSAYDAQGQFIGMSAFAQNLQDSLMGLTAEQRNSALGTIFGSDAIRGASIVMEAGAKGVDEYTAAVNDQGAASRMASTQLDNLSGDLEALKGSIETALISGGSKATGVLRGVTQSATGMVNAFSEAPGWLQSTAMGFAGVGGSALVVAGAVGSMIPKIRETKAAFSQMGSSTKLAMGGVGLALTVGAMALADWAKKKQEAKQRTDEFVSALQADGGAIGANTKEYIKATLVKQGLADDVAKLQDKMTSGRDAIEVYSAAVQGDKASMIELMRAMSGTEGGMDGLLVKTMQQIDALGKAGIQTDALAGTQKTAIGIQNELAGAQSAFNDLIAEGVTSGDVYEAAKTRLNSATSEQKRVTDTAATAQAGLGNAVALTSGEIKEQQAAIDELVGSMYSQEGATRAALGGQIDYEEAQTAVTEAEKKYTTAVKEHGKGSPEAIKAQQDQRRAILGVWAAGEQAATKIGEFTAANEGLGTVATALSTTGGVHKLMKGLEAQRDALGPNDPLRVRLQEYINKLKNDIPENVKTELALEVTAFITTQSKGSTIGPNKKALASGGAAFAGQEYTVNEHGPEPFFPATDGRIISHHDAMDALSSGGGNDATMQLILSELRRLNRNSGGVQIGTVNTIDADGLITKLERQQRSRDRLVAR